LLAVVVVAVPALSAAQQPAPPAAPPAAAPQVPASPPPAPYDPYAPQPAYGAPPPPYGAPGYGAPPYGYATPYGAPTPVQLMIYENEKKSAGLALVLQILLPGVGSIYADHVAGALITWGGMVGGVVLIVAGVNEDVRSIDNGTSMPSNSGAGLILAGVAAYIGFWIYGLVDAYQSANEYNTELARKLRLPMMSLSDLSVAPIRTAQGTTTLAPTLTWRF
jgi:TM2 domain-containing membrane protein YozV